MVKNKRELKKIAKEWCQSILLANGMDSFVDIEDGLLDIEEVGYIVDETHKIAKKLTDEHPEIDLNGIIKKYFTLDED